jgi:hypothetical protein
MVNKAFLACHRGADMSSHRDNVLPFISGVPGARFKGFSTHEKAAAFYSDAKDNRLVKVIRNPGDEEFFGALHVAMQ